MSAASTVKKKVSKRGRVGEGRPSKYKPEYCKQLIEHCKAGKTFESFCTRILINPDTMYEWARNHSEFSEAKKIAKQFAVDYHWEKLDTSATEKSHNPTPSIYMLKCLGQADDKELRQLQIEKLKLEIAKLKENVEDADLGKELSDDQVRKIHAVVNSDG